MFGWTFFEEVIAISIEFHCPDCGSMLRVPDNAAGRQARCGSCQGLSLVPLLEEPDRADVGASRSHYSPPVGDAPASDGPPVSVNPYASVSTAATSGSYAMSEGAVRAKLNGPAVGLFVACALELLGGLFVGVRTLGDMVNPNLGQQPEELFILFVVFGLALVRAVIIGTTAYCMMNLRGYAYCIFGAIICIIPCGSGCCLVSIPLGIWAVVALNEYGVKQAFATVASRYL